MAVSGDTDPFLMRLQRRSTERWPGAEGQGGVRHSGHWAEYQWVRHGMGLGQRAAERRGGGGSVGRQNKKRVHSADRNERSRGRSRLHGQDMGKTQDHRNGIDRWLAVGGWRLAVGGWRLAVGGCWSLGGAVFKGYPQQKKIWGS